MLYYLLTPLVGAGAFYYARYRQFERVTTVAMMMAVAFYYTYFFLTPWYQFTPDPYEHAKYVKILAEQERIPRPLESSATRHPPTYYIMAAALYKIASWEHDAEPIKMTRHLSVALFVVFILCNIELLRLFFPTPVAGYYASLGLLLYWPIGITISGRISCDLLLYAAQSGVFLALAYWFKKKHISYLSWAFIAAGICILAKNTGIIMLALTGIVWLYEIAKNRFRDWQRFFSCEQVLAILFAGGCYLLTKQHDWVTNGELTQLEHHSGEFFLKSLITFDPILFLTDTAMGDSQGMFWNAVLHSLLLGYVEPWKLMNSLILLNVCWALILCYMLWGLRGAAATLSTAGKELTLIFMAYLLLSIGGMIYIMIQTSNLLYADGHYIYPVVGIIALTFGWVMDRHRMLGHSVQYRIGSVLAASFVGLSVMLFMAQWML